MKTILELLSLSKEFLASKGVLHPRREAETLLASSLGLKKMDLYLQYDHLVEEEKISSFREGIKRRALGEPLEYILGKVDFYKHEFLINPSVLIPRVETEWLVDCIVKQLAQEDVERKVLWDVCSGSGCIGISLKKAFPSLHVCLSDISPAALEVAKENGRRLGADVEFRLGDLLEPFGKEKAHYLVSNPPYVSRSDYETLEPSVKRFEPQGALVGGESGFEYYERFSERLEESLAPSGKAFFEIGDKMGEGVSKIFSRYACQVKKDLFQRDRLFFLEKQ